MNETLPPLTSDWLKNERSGMKQVLESMIRRDRFDDSSLRQAVEDLHDGFIFGKKVNT